MHLWDSDFGWDASKLYPTKISVTACTKRKKSFIVTESLSTILIMCTCIFNGRNMVKKKELNTIEKMYSSKLEIKKKVYLSFRLCARKIRIASKKAIKITKIVPNSILTFLTNCLTIRIGNAL